MIRAVLWIALGTVVAAVACSDDTHDDDDDGTASGMSACSVNTTSALHSGQLNTSLHTV